MYTEPQMLDALDRLTRVYLESYPDDREGLDRFVRWIYAQYGYKYE